MEITNIHLIRGSSDKESLSFAAKLYEQNIVRPLLSSSAVLVFTLKYKNMIRNEIFSSRNNC